MLQGLLNRAETGALAGIRKLGVVAVVVAALTPVPFSLVCYLAGSLRMPLGIFFLAILARIPRMAIFYYIIAAAWGL